MNSRNAIAFGFIKDAPWKTVPRLADTPPFGTVRRDAEKSTALEESVARNLLANMQ